MARDLLVQSLGMWRPGRVRRILMLAGLRPRLVPRLGQPLGLSTRGRGSHAADDGKNDGDIGSHTGPMVGVWGQGPLAWRGEWVARRYGMPVVRIEDAFLRSVLPGRAGGAGSAPLGLLIDPTGGVHYDPERPSGLEALLAGHPLDDPDLLGRARQAMARMAAGEISKYTLHLPDAPLPDPGFVLVVDQTLGDASVRASGADRETFRKMLAAACAEHPGQRVIIKQHPEASLGLRPGHLGPEDAEARAELLGAAVPVPSLLRRARAVYTVSSQLGFEAVMAGLRPHVFGRPFYAGWGLCEERHCQPLPRRGRALGREQLFAAAMLLAPTWHDPCRDGPASLEQVLDQIEAEARVWQEDHAGHVATGMRAWKRAHLHRHFGRHRRLRLAARPEQALALASAEDRGLLVWGSAPLGVPHIGTDGAARGPARHDRPHLGQDGRARDGNTGGGSTGGGSTGGGNTGDGNTGDGNTGDGNTGDGNTGEGNTGDMRAAEGRASDGHATDGRAGGGAYGANGAAQPAAAPPRPVAGPRIRLVEEGYLRSRGLGADLYPPLSLITDTLGLPHDPRQPSQLEQMIASPCPPGGEARAAALIEYLIRHGLGKYNTGAPQAADPSAPGQEGLRVLAVGQVEDDASVILGARAVRTNLGLLNAARAAHPDARILYKPHPDVEAGLRPGAVSAHALKGLGATALPGLSAAAAIALADEVWTITSTLGFEALIRGKPVTCLGAPFYAGWGLTRDLGPVPARRAGARPSLGALAHAVLIGYPRYLDPVSGLPCPAEVAAERLAAGISARRGPVLTALAKAQRLLVSQGAFWR